MKLSRDVLVFLVATGAILCARFLDLRWRYEEGFHFDRYAGGLPPSMLAFPLSLLLVMACMALIGVRLQRGLKKPEAQVQCAFRGALLCSIIVVVMVVFMTVEPGYVTFTQGFRDRILRESVLAELHPWAHAVAVDPKDGMIPVDDLPQQVRGLSPAFAEVLPDGSVRITWGGGFGHWGVEISPRENPREGFIDGELHIPLDHASSAWHEVQ